MISRLSPDQQGSALCVDTCVGLMGRTVNQKLRLYGQVLSFGRGY